MRKKIIIIACAIIATIAGAKIANANAKFEVWLKDVPAGTTLAGSNTFASFTSGATKVINLKALTNSNGWQTLSFDSPFTHTAGKAVLVAVRGVGCSYGGGCGRTAYYTSVSNTHWYKHVDATSEAPLSNDPGTSVTGSVDGYKTNIKFTITPAPTPPPSSGSGECEDFEGFSGAVTSYSGTGALPTGWTAIYTGGVAYNPKLYSGTSYRSSFNNTGNCLAILSGTSVGCNNTCLVFPADYNNASSLSFDAWRENGTNGTVSFVVIQSPTDNTIVRTISSLTAPTYSSATEASVACSFSDLTPLTGTQRYAMIYNYNSSYYGAFIDNVCATFGGSGGSPSSSTCYGFDSPAADAVAMSPSLPHLEINPNPLPDGFTYIYNGSDPRGNPKVVTNGVIFNHANSTGNRLAFSAGQQYGTDTYIIFPAKYCNASQISFDSWAQGTGNAPTLEFGYVTNATTGAGFTSIGNCLMQQYSTASSTLNTFNSLPSLPAGARLALRYHATASNTTIDGFIDNICATIEPECYGFEDFTAPLGYTDSHSSNLPGKGWSFIYNPMASATETTINIGRPKISNSYIHSHATSPAALLWAGGSYGSANYIVFPAKYNNAVSISFDSWVHSTYNCPVIQFGYVTNPTTGEGWTQIGSDCCMPQYSNSSAITLNEYGEGSSTPLPTLPDGARYVVRYYDSGTKSAVAAFFDNICAIIPPTPVLDPGEVACDFSENFNDFVGATSNPTSTGDLPEGYDQIFSGTTPCLESKVVNTSSFCKTGLNPTKSIVIPAGNAPTFGYTNYLVFPESYSDAHGISSHAWQNSTTGTNELIFGYVTNINDAGSFVAISHFQKAPAYNTVSASESLVKNSFAIPQDMPAGARLAVKYTSSQSPGYVLIDNICLESACTPPTINLSETYNITIAGCGTGQQVLASLTNSPGEITWTPQANSGISVSGNTITASKCGTYTLTFDQVASGDYCAAHKEITITGATNLPVPTAANQQTCRGEVGTLVYTGEVPSGSVLRWFTAHVLMNNDYSYEGTTCSGTISLVSSAAITRWPGLVCNNGNNCQSQRHSSPAVITPYGPSLNPRLQNPEDVNQEAFTSFEIPLTNSNIPYETGHIVFTWTSDVFASGTGNIIRGIATQSGEYVVTCTYLPTGCSETVTIPITVSESGTGASCGLIYCDATNGDDANDGSSIAPVRTLKRALALVGADASESNMYQIRLAAGTYNLTRSLNLKSHTIIDGGWQNGEGNVWTKTYGTTKILRKNTNVEGTAAAPRLVALEGKDLQNFALQDVEVNTENAVELPEGEEAPTATIGNPLSAYTVTSGSQTYTEISGTTLPFGATDDDVVKKFPVPFDIYVGNSYLSAGDNLSVSSNGQVNFGYASGELTSGTSFSSDATIIAPLGVDLKLDNSSIQYLTTGTAPNRVLTIQWKNIRNNNASGKYWNFQIKIYETTNVIEFCYGSSTGTYSASYSMYIREKGATTNLYNVTSFSPITVTYQAAAASLSSITNPTIASGTKITFTPGSTLADIEADVVVEKSNSGISTYGLHLANCTGYTINRCQISAGNATKGRDGATGATGGNASGRYPGDSSSPRKGGSGGSGGTGGTGGSSASAGKAGGNGLKPDGTTTYSGGTGGTSAHSTYCNSSYARQGGNGTDITINGANGVSGSNAELSNAINYVCYFVPAKGTDGTDGTGGWGGSGGGGGGGAGARCSGNYASSTGGSGGDGGGGGAGGVAGKGGNGGGSSFGLYLYNSSYPVDNSLNITSGLAGQKGSGGTGGNGGTGGTGAVGGSTSIDYETGGIHMGILVGTAQGGSGGKGGNGGSGGKGGNGGNGAAGVSYKIAVVNNSGLQSSVTSGYTDYPASNIITKVDYSKSNKRGCTNMPIYITKTASLGSLPANASYAAGYNGSESETAVKFSATGIYTIAGTQIYITSTGPAVGTISGETQFSYCEPHRYFYNGSLQNGETVIWTLYNSSNLQVDTNFETYNGTALLGYEVPTGLLDGDYTLKAAVKTNCCGMTEDAILNINISREIQGFDISIANNTVNCNSSSTLLQAQEVAGGVYSWEHDGATSQNVTVEPDVETTYRVTVTQGECSATAEKIVYVDKAAPEATIDAYPGVTVIDCINTNITLTAPAGLTYAWSGNGSGTSQSISTTSAGTYNLLVTGANGCTASSSKTLTLNRPAFIAGSISAGGAICLGESVQIASTANASGGQGTISYKWESSTDGGTSWTNIPSATAASYNPGTATQNIQYRRLAKDQYCLNDYEVSGVYNVNLNLPTEEVANGDYVWTGATNTTWATTTNWLKWNGATYVTVAVQPQAESNVLITNSNLCVSNFPNGANTNISNLTIGNNASLNLGANNLQVANMNLNANGTLNGGSGTLSVKGNFANNGTFNAGTGTVTFNGTTAQTLSGNAVSFYNFTMNNAAGLTINAEPTINNSATFTNGNVESNMTFAQNASSTSNAGSYLIGKVTKTGSGSAFTFPTGTSVLYAPLTANVSNGSTVKVAYVHDGDDGEPFFSPVTYNDATGNMDPGLHHVSQRENWSFEGNGTLSNITMSWYGGQDKHIVQDLSDPNWEAPTFSDIESSVVVAYAYYDGENSSQWKIAEGGLSHLGNINEGSISLSGSIQVTGSTERPEEVVRALVLPRLIVTFGSRKFVDGAHVILPISLLTFEGKCDGTSAELFWATASETNNEWFVVEKSADAVNFVEIGRLQGAGTTIEQQNYTYTDNYMLGGNNYYRLRQIDYDGKESVSEIISLNCNDDLDFCSPAIYAYPNPFHDDITIVIENMTEDYSIELYNELGQRISAGNLSDTRNDYRTAAHELHLSNLAPATYYVRVISANHVLMHKIVKQ